MNTRTLTRIPYIFGAAAFRAITKFEGCAYELVDNLQTKCRHLADSDAVILLTICRRCATKNRDACLGRGRRRALVPLGMKARDSLLRPPFHIGACLAQEREYKVGVLVGQDFDDEPNYWKHLHVGTVGIVDLLDATKAI